MAATLLSVAAKSAAGPRSSTARAVDALPQVRTNLSSAERWVSLAAGGALFTLGFDGRGPGLLSSLVGGYLLYRAATGNCVAYQAFGVSTADSTARNTAVAAGHGTRVDHVVTVMKPVSEVYAFWRDFENLPRFMSHLLDVDTTTDGRSRWVAKGPLGTRVEWEAEIVTDTPNRVIAWRSLDGADVDNAGSVRFTELPHGQGTEVRVELKFDPPAGRLGSAVARLFGENPDQQIREDLQRFKQVMESGEARTTVDKATGKR